MTKGAAQGHHSASRMLNGEDTRLWALTDLDHGKLCICKIMHHPQKMSSIHDKLVKFGLNVIMSITSKDAIV